jgi:lipopolysaccharide/colanic/teichoic acid biosynthesis glycosyltransferase
MLTSANSEVMPKNIDSSKQDVFLYIGESPFFYNYLRPFFNNCKQVISLAQAKGLLSESAELPELIILDIPLNHFELVAFKVWARTNEFHRIPVIYNHSNLAASQIKQLYSQKLVDDVVSLETNYQKLNYKLKFIKKINNSGGRSINVKKEITGNAHKFSLGNKILDVTLSSIAIIFCLPLFIIIALAVKLESKGPVFYCAHRAGKGFKVFRFFKFRTMVVNADKQINELASLNQYSNDGDMPAFFKLHNDPRVTRIGSFLRKTSLDELPQLFNVLKGDMSIVGNRPLPLYEASTLTTDAWAERFMAPAGITGLWQVSKRGKEDMSNEERILLDINYARTRSFLGDIRILLQTPGALIQKTNV